MLQQINTETNQLHLDNIQKRSWNKHNTPNAPWDWNIYLHLP